MKSLINQMIVTIQKIILNVYVNFLLQSVPVRRKKV